MARAPTTDVRDTEPFSAPVPDRGPDSTPAPPVGGNGFCSFECLDGLFLGWTPSDGLTIAQKRALGGGASTVSAYLNIRPDLVEGIALFLASASETPPIDSAFTEEDWREELSVLDYALFNVGVNDAARLADRLSFQDSPEAREAAVILFEKALLNEPEFLNPDRQRAIASKITAFMVREPDPARRLKAIDILMADEITPVTPQMTDMLNDIAAGPAPAATRGRALELAARVATADAPIFGVISVTLAESDADMRQHAISAIKMLYLNLDEQDTALAAQLAQFDAGVAALLAQGDLDEGIRYEASNLLLNYIRDRQEEPSEDG